MSEPAPKVIVAGSGPAGYTAAIYLSRANIPNLMYEGLQPGGQLTITTDVENYPGFPEGVMGPEMMELFRKQVEKFGTRFVHKAVVDVDFSTRPFKLTADGGDTYAAHSVIVASGASKPCSRALLRMRSTSSPRPSCDRSWTRDLQLQPREALHRVVRADVLFEDTAAMLGLIVAFLGILLGQVTGNLYFDGAASVVIGLILAATAGWLAYETKGLLIGEAANRPVVEGIRAIVRSHDKVKHVNEVLTMHVGPEFILANLSVEFADFAKVDLRVVRIARAEHVDGADKLLRLTLDLGGDRQRTVFSGIRSAYNPESLEGRLTVVVANLKPRKMRFGVSEGMVLAAGPGGSDIFVLQPDDGAQPGMRVK